MLAFHHTILLMRTVFTLRLEKKNFQSFSYKNVTKFQSHYKSYNHSYSCSGSNGKLSCPVSVSNPVCNLGVKASRTVSISKSICTVSISKSICPVNISKSTAPVNFSKSTSPVYVSKTIRPVIVSSSPVDVSKSSNPVNVLTRAHSVNISKPLVNLNWVRKQFEITLMFTKVSSFESLSDFLILSTNFHFVFLSLILLKLRKKKLIFFLFSFFFLTLFFEVRIRHKRI